MGTTYKCLAATPNNGRMLTIYGQEIYNIQQTIYTNLQTIPKKFIQENVETPENLHCYIFDHSITFYFLTQFYIYIIYIYIFSTFL